MALSAGQPLLRAASRRWAAALLAGCVTLVAVLGVLFAGHSSADPLDNAIDSPIVDWLGPHVGLLLWLAGPGTTVPAVVVSVAIVAGCLVAGRLNGAVLGAVAAPIAVALAEGLLKPLVNRTFSGQFSYPSGHSTTVFSLVATLTVLLVAGPRPRTVRWRVLSRLIPAVACLLGLGVATAVIALRYHYFTDTLAGAAVGIGTVCALALILDLPLVRRALGAREPTASRRGWSRS
jgi:membrane-associated phospholipid phosphatase